MSFHGARYLHILVPCPLGWGFHSSKSVEMARLATLTGLFPVFEAEYGMVKNVAKIRQLHPVEDYLKGQKRYAHLFGKKANPEVIHRLQVIADRNIEKFGLLSDEEPEKIPTSIEADERAELV